MAPARVRALATSGARRSEMFPDVPTMSEAGVAGYEFTQWYGLLVPAKTPREIVNTLNVTLLKAMDDRKSKSASPVKPLRPPRERRTSFPLISKENCKRMRK